jgi:hypothetical protein
MAESNVYSLPEFIRSFYKLSRPHTVIYNRTTKPKVEPAIGATEDHIFTAVDLQQLGMLLYINFACAKNCCNYSRDN